MIIYRHKPTGKIVHLEDRDGSFMQKFIGPVNILDIIQGNDWEEVEKIDNNPLNLEVKMTLLNCYPLGAHYFDLP